MGRKQFSAMVILTATIALPFPAWADVQAGLNAWALSDHATAIHEWQGPASAGDPDAQFLLAEAYKQGLGVEQDLTKAEELYEKAAAQGHIEASDLYGLLLFDRGQRVRAMPYVRAAAERGEPRAQYLLGLAHFNGDLAVKDWVRAYALVSLARQFGLARAGPALAEMDKYIPLEQRQQAVALASDLASQAQANHARQLAATDLGTTRQPGTGVTAPTLPSAKSAAAAASHVATSSGPQSAGADYARPVQAPPPKVATRQPPMAAPRSATANVPTRAAPARALPSGPWRVQLGAFGVAANADAMWKKLRARPELAGHPRINAAAGKVFKLQAGGFATQASAQTACSRLAAAGVSCLAVRN